MANALIAIGVLILIACVLATVETRIKQKKDDDRG
jgi:hypothetical protein